MADIKISSFSALVFLKILKMNQMKKWCCLRWNILRKA